MPFRVRDLDGPGDVRFTTFAGNLVHDGLADLGGVVFGSVEVGKRADFAVLEDDPLAVGAERLKDVPVWGTVLGGRVFQAPRAR